MRVVLGYEKKQRGCQYCLHSENARQGSQIRTGCPFSECPYTVLDKYRTYEEYLASEDSKIFVGEYFISGTDFWEWKKSSAKQNRTFSDGDAKVGW